MNRSSIRIVRGYHSATPACPSAESASFRYRFATIFEALGGDIEVPLFLAVISEVQKFLGCDSVYAKLDTGQEVLTMEALADALVTHKEGADEEECFPVELQFARRGQCICIGSLEMWVYSGGPQPYSDSVTLALYTASDNSVLLERACRSAALIANGIVADVVEGSTWPQ